MQVHHGQHAGVRDQDVDFAVDVHRLGDEGADGGEGAGVGLHGEGAGAGGGEEGAGREEGLDERRGGGGGGGEEHDGGAEGDELWSLSWFLRIKVEA